MSGIDLEGMQHEQMKENERREELKKKAEAERLKKEKEDEEKKKREAEEALPEEEKLKIATKKKAEEKKALGNDLYKKKQFKEALEKYEEAIQLDNTELLYYNNKAACYMELKEYDKALEECDKAITKSREGYYDFVKLGKVLGRKGNAMLAKN